MKFRLRICGKKTTEAVARPSRASDRQSHVSLSVGFLRYRLTFCLCNKYLGEEGATEATEVSPGSHRAPGLPVVASVYDSYLK